MAATTQLKPDSCGIPFAKRSSLPGDMQGRSKVIAGTANHNRRLASRSNGDDCQKRFEADSSLSVIEVEALLRKRVRLCRTEDLLQKFHQYDPSSTLGISRGEFRQALEAIGMPLSTTQFDAIANKVSTNSRGMILYGDFLEKFHGGFEINGDRRSRGSDGSANKEDSTQEMNVDALEKMLREKLQKRPREIIKALHFYDCNRDGHIQRQEFRKVLEASTMKITDKLFDRLYQRYDFQRRGVINYKEFLQRLGFNVDRHCRADIDDGPATPNKHRSSLQMNNINLDHIESIFRNKMRENYVYLTKMFMAFDRKADGFIAIEDLKSVLNHFTLPMNNEVFTQLMDRAGIKATGKIAWESFIEKFQNPQNNFNGQTLPIKPGHKFFPQRGGNQPISSGEMILLLREHIAAAYPSLKEAFLRMDKNRDGRISRSELRRVIDKFKFELNNEQFNELMACLDPQRTNFISYQNFLNIFEQKDSPIGHKWLATKRIVREADKPAILAWGTVEEILRSKLAANWKDFSKAIVKYDKFGSGLVKTEQLRRVIEKFCMAISTDHYENLLERFGGDVSEGNVDYGKMLQSLGVVVRPGDMNGISAQITNGSQQEQQRREDDLNNRQKELGDNVAARANVMSSEEIICRIKDRIAQHWTHFRQAFECYDKRNAGKISKQDFKKLLNSIGIELTPVQFGDLCTQLHFHNGSMSYMHFVENFEDPRLGNKTETLYKLSNHRVNAIRGDEYGMDAVTVENKLRNKLRENFEGLRAAFYKFDDEHRGVLTRKNFRRMLDAFMITMNDAEFEKLCQKLCLDKQSRISYVDFLTRFEVKETKDGHKWLNSDEPIIAETSTTPLMTAEEVHSILGMKAHGRWAHLAEAFRSLNARGCAVIRKKELRQTLNKFSLFMSKPEFERLWNCYDIECKGYVSYADFQSRITNNEFSAGDIQGISDHIVQGSKRAIELHHRGQQARQQLITMRQTQVAENSISASDVLQQLRDRIRDQHSDFYTAFRAFDRQRKGFLSVDDIEDMLIKFGYFLNNEEFEQFLNRLGMVSKKAQLSYDQFLSVFEEGQKTSYPRVSVPPVSYPNQQGTKHLTPEIATANMMERIASNMSLIQNACQTFDPEQTGNMALDDFKRVLDNFVFKMTPIQFSHFSKNRLLISSNSMVNYASLLDEFRETQILTVAEPGTSSSPQNHDSLSLDQLQEQLKDAISVRFHQLARAFSQIDYAKIGVLSRQDFRDIVTKHLLKITDQQFDSIWANLSVNEFGNVDYRNFLLKYTCANKAGFDTTRASVDGRCSIATPGGQMFRLPNRPQTAQSVANSRCSSVEPRRPFTPLVDAENAEKRLQRQVCRNWKHIQRLCRMYDMDNTGVISQNDVRDILNSQQVSLSEDDISKLLTKYDLHNNDTFCYSEFLRHIVLDANRQPLLRRAKTTLHNMSIQEEPSNMAPVAEETTACARVHACVLDNWRAMRRELRAADPHLTGLVSASVLRQVLRNHNINMSEQDFMEVLASKDITDDVNYNGFIKSFLN